jgi:hypothetical protein
MYLYKIKYNDNTTEYVEATDVQNACSVAKCEMSNIISVVIVREVSGEN